LGFGDWGLELHTFVTFFSFLPLLQRITKPQTPNPKPQTPHLSFDAATVAATAWTKAMKSELRFVVCGVTVVWGFGVGFGGLGVGFWGLGFGVCRERPQILPRMRLPLLLISSSVLLLLLMMMMQVVEDQAYVRAAALRYFWRQCG